MTNRAKDVGIDRHLSLSHNKDCEMGRTSLLVLLLSIVWALVFSCREPIPDPEPEQPSFIAVTSISVNPTSIDIFVGGSFTISVSVLPSNATDKRVAWSSSNPSVATVKDGIVEAIQAGSSTITASVGGCSATCLITVTNPVVPVSSVQLSHTQIEMEVGSTQQLDVTIEPTNATEQTVEWSSSDPLTASVNNGLISAIKEGAATISASAGGITATCVVTVFIPVVPVASVELNHSSIQLEEGQTEELTATVLPTNATDKTITWVSENTSVAVVNGGVVSAIGEGETTVIAQAGDKTASCKVVVKKKYVEPTSITLDHEELTIAVGETAVITATVLPENATNKEVEWTSSHEGLVRVSQDGEVTGIAQGSCTIYARLKNNGLTASCLVKVVVPVSSITISPKELKMKQTATYPLHATVSPNNASNKQIKWVSLNEELAVVDQNGVVTALKEGTVKIRAIAEEKFDECTITIEKYNQPGDNEDMSDEDWK